MKQPQIFQYGHAKISELCDFRKGKKVSSSKVKTKNSVPYLLIDTLRGAEPEFFTEDKNYTDAIPDDILIVADGANSGLVGTGVSGAVGSTILRIRIKAKDLNKDYLSYFLKSKFEEFNKDMKGTGIPHLKPQKMLESEIRKPSLSEQTLIVSEIEKQFTRLDEAVKSLTAVKEKLEVYRKAVLKNAFEGRLVEILETNSESFLKELFAERKAHWEKTQLSKYKKKNKTFKGERWKERYKVAKTFKNSDLFFKIPKDWITINFDTIANVTKLAGFEFTKYVKYKDNEEIPVIRALNISKGKFLFGNYKYIDKKTFDLLGRSKLYGREILMVFVGSTGNVALCPNDQEYFLGPNVAKIDLFTNKVDKKYLIYFLISEFGRESINQLSKSTTQSSISMENIRNIKIPLPASLVEQAAIVQSIESKFSIINKVEEVVNQSLEKAEKLRKSILKSAFEGKLIRENKE